MKVRIGMDLTKIVLPTFILERRSLLEMYADFFVHPEIFTDIASKTTQEERMVQVFFFYFSEHILCCFYRYSSGICLPSVPVERETMQRNLTTQFLVKFSSAGGLFLLHLVQLPLNALGLSHGVQPRIWFSKQNR